MEFVYHPVALVADVPEQGGLAVELKGDDDYVLFREQGGNIVATGRMCPHQNELLDTGCLEGDEVICRRHHLRFNIRTGNCTNANGFTLQTYRTKVEGDTVYIGSWEDADEADRSC